jgi:hypothetical protein
MPVLPGDLSRGLLAVVLGEVATSWVEDAGAHSGVGNERHRLGLPVGAARNAAREPAWVPEIWSW